MARTHAPISAFGNELLEALRKGSEKEFIITFDNPSMAIRFRHRINRFRTAAKSQKLSGWEELYRCAVRIDKARPCSVILTPQDAEFRDALSRAQVVDLPPPLSIEVAVPTPSPDDDPASTFLGELASATRVPKKPSDLLD